MKMFGLGCAACCAIAGIARGQEHPRFGVDVEAVYVDVFVSRDDRPVPDLRAENFEVLDQDVPQQVQLLAAQEAPLEVVIALDTSQSVEGEVLEALRAASRSFLVGLPGNARASLVAFSHAARLVAGPTAPREILPVLDRTAAGGGTALHDALFAAIALSQTPGRRPLILAFTDGADTASWLDAGQVQAMARQCDAVVYVVGIDAALEGRGTGSLWKQPVQSGTRAGDVDIRETRRAAALRELAEETGGRLLLSPSAAGLHAAFTRILAESQTRYLLSFSPQGVARGGWHALTVRLRGTSGDARARRGYMSREATGSQAAEP
jgi:VWFA-related protein